jgi:hypothetical protein
MFIPYLVSSILLMCQDIGNEAACSTHMYQCMYNHNQNSISFEFLEEDWQDYYLEICIENLSFDAQN